MSEMPGMVWLKIKKDSYGLCSCEFGGTLSLKSISIAVINGTWDKEKKDMLSKGYRMYRIEEL